MDLKTTSNAEAIYLYNEKDYENDKLTTQIFVQNNQKFRPTSKYVGLVKIKKVRKPLLGIADILLCLIIISPCVVGVWRGVWQLMDIYNKHFQAWPCLLLGISVHTVFVLNQNSLNDIIKKKSSNNWRKISNMILTRIYVYVFCVACNMHWRGSWMVIDKYFDIQISATGTVLKIGNDLFILLIGCLLLLTALRSLCNSIAPPFIICLDKKDRIFVIPTRFRAKVSEKASLYILDCLFSVLVIGTLVVFVWRGAWALIDIFLFPENEVWSAWGSLIVGYSAVAITFMLQPFMRWICDRITGVARLLVADLFLILSLIGTVNVWRGIWNLLNIYLLPEDLELSCWLTHWVCLIVLILLGCSNSLLVRGVYKDAEEPAGKCVVFPCYYLRLIFREQKLRKLQNEQNKTELVNVKPFENNHIVQNTKDQCMKTINVSHREGGV